MKIIRNNKKLFLGIIIGLIISSVTVYAASGILFQSSQVSFDNTQANLTKSNGDPVETVEEAIESLARNNTPTCSNSPFQVGDYIDMTPTSTSFTPDTLYTGFTSTPLAINPSELNVWRVIKINPDCTVEVVSEYVSNMTVQFKGKIGYMNYIWYLNEIAKQYENTTYTLNPSTAPDGAFRNVGYDKNKQTAKIIDDTRIDDTTLGTTAGAWYRKTTLLNGEESKGGGEQGYTTDLKLLDDAGVSISASKTNSTSLDTYWISSRLFRWVSTSEWNFYVNFVGNNGLVSSVYIYRYYSGNFLESNNGYAVRPIVTLKSGLGIASGNGTSSSHYTLSAS